MIQNFSSLVLGVVLSFTYSWQFTLVMLCLIPAVVGSTFMQLKLQKGMTRKMVEAYKPWTAMVSETAQNYKTVFSCANEEIILKYYRFSLMLPYRAQAKKALCSGIVFGFS